MKGKRESLHSGFLPLRSTGLQKRKKKGWRGIFFLAFFQSAPCNFPFYEQQSWALDQ